MRVLRTRYGLFEALAGDAVDGIFGRGGEDLVAALTQDGDGLRADQVGAADNDLHGVPSVVDCWRRQMGSNAPPRMSRGRLTIRSIALSIDNQH
jgi:hypothetical protein